jgi:hypothetical protein
MSFEKLVEEKIREAMENGEFDNLPGKGKPIDLSAYFATPEDLRLAHSILKNAGIIPEEIQLLSEIGSLKESIKGCCDPEKKALINRQIEELTMKYNLLKERAKGRSRPRS